MAPPGFCPRRIFEFVKESREQQDNEQWHLLILEEIVQKQGRRENYLLFRIVPQTDRLFLLLSHQLDSVRDSTALELTCSTPISKITPNMNICISFQENPAMENRSFL